MDEQFQELLKSGIKIWANKKEDNFLSNIAEDVTETRNLADSNPDIVKRLPNLHENWQKDIYNK
ncbi:MAG: hypothetical protein WAV28_08755 [Sedimentisphaerales bacterium]